MLEDEFDNLIEDAIDSLIDDSPEKAAECLVELAHVWASCGMPRSSFENLRKYIVNEAESRTDAVFIREKLTIAEQFLREQRHAKTSAGFVH